MFSLGDGCFFGQTSGLKDLGNRSKKDADQKFSTFLFVVGEEKKVTPWNMNGWNQKNSPT